MIDSNQSKTKMNDITNVGKIYVYMYILQEIFTSFYQGYEILKKFSDIFQSYLVIYQQRVICLK